MLTDILSGGSLGVSLAMFSYLLKVGADVARLDERLKNHIETERGK